MSVTVAAATADDAEQILKLQYLCYQEEAQLHGDWAIEPLTQSLADLRAELDRSCALIARLGDEAVGSVRARVDESGVARIDRLVVHPRMRGHGLGGRLLLAAEERTAATAERPVLVYRLLSSRQALGNLRLYRRLGYREAERAADGRADLVVLEKPARPRAAGGGGSLAATA